MDSKTPKFDNAINEILNNLQPQQRVCQQCQNNFDILAEDIEMYKKLRVPPSALCPNCRRQTRRAFANFTTLYKRKCSAPGHEEKIISQVPEGSKSPIYDFDYYWSDQNDPTAHGMAYDSEKPFFAQFKKLLDSSPQPATTRDPMSINSEYTSYGAQLKDCYYIFGGVNSENVYYGNWPIKTRDSVDVMVATSCERSYEIVASTKCYNCKFAYFSEDCVDSSFIFDCRNCRNCFGCINLRNKEYYFFNEPLSKGEYEEKIKSIDLGDRNILKEYQEKFLELVKKSPKRNAFNKNAVNSVGTLLENCSNCYMSFFARGGSENNRYTELHMRAEECMDILLGTTPKRCYYSVVSLDGADIKFSILSRNQCFDLEYCINSKSCSHCFGCIGLTNKQFHIFNKPYPEEEYWEKLDEIKTEMLRRGEYGEFFPMSFSVFPYNASLAQLLVPLTKEKAQEQGLWWFENEADNFNGKVLTREDIPTGIKDFTEEMAGGVIKCEKTGKLFRVTKVELGFYRRENLPIPTISPGERLFERFNWLGNFKLDLIKCGKCNKDILATLSLGIKDNVYCETCYQAEVV